LIDNRTHQQISDFQITPIFISDNPGGLPCIFYFFVFGKAEIVLLFSQNQWIYGNLSSLKNADFFSRLAVMLLCYHPKVKWEKVQSSYLTLTLLWGYRHANFFNVHSSNN